MFHCFAQVDNDDGSAFYHTHDNFLVYGGQGMKNDFGGHECDFGSIFEVGFQQIWRLILIQLVLLSNHHYGNIYAYAGRALGAFVYKKEV